MDDKNYWENYYKKRRKPWKESAFAVFVSNYIKKDKSLIELWCWNARDSIYLNNLWLNVTAIDQCEDEINFLDHMYWSNSLNFVTWDFTNISNNNIYDYIYSRFTFHAINEEAGKRTLNRIFNSLNSGGKFFLEVRSTNDDFFWKWEQIGKHDFVTDHYRRFIKYNDFIKKLTKIWFFIEFKTESRWLAVYKDEDPMIIRIIARKQ